jgi:hypothetical protein
MEQVAARAPCHHIRATASEFAHHFGFTDEELEARPPAEELADEAE